jgi:hypothetical protein
VNQKQVRLDEPMRERREHRLGGETRSTVRREKAARYRRSSKENAEIVSKARAPDQEIGEDTVQIGATLLFPTGNIGLAHRSRYPPLDTNVF